MIGNGTDDRPHQVSGHLAEDLKVIDTGKNKGRLAGNLASVPTVGSVAGPQKVVMTVQPQLGQDGKEEA